LLDLERRGLLPKLHLTTAEIGTDETILDVTITKRPLVPGRFALVLLTAGTTGHITGPDCLTVWLGPHSRGPQLVLRLAGDDRSAAVHFKGSATKLAVFLTPGRHILTGEVDASLDVPIGGGWLSDAQPGDRLVLDVPAGRSTFCDLSPLSKGAR